jgi:hypothetical protein
MCGSPHPTGRELGDSETTAFCPRASRGAHMRARPTLLISNFEAMLCFAIRIEGIA